MTAKRKIYIITRGEVGWQDYFINLCRKKFLLSNTVVEDDVCVVLSQCDDVKVNLIRASLLNNSNLVGLMGNEWRHLFFFRDEHLWHMCISSSSSSSLFFTHVSDVIKVMNFYGKMRMFSTVEKHVHILLAHFNAFYAQCLCSSSFYENSNNYKCVLFSKDDEMQTHIHTLKNCA